MTAAETPDAIEGAGDVGRLTRIAGNLWLDLDEVVSVRTGRGKAYDRVVTLTTRTSGEHKVTVYRGTGTERAGNGDEAVVKWLLDNLGSLFGGSPKSLGDPA